MVLFEEAVLVAYFRIRHSENVWKTVVETYCQREFYLAPILKRPFL
jgi:hypothetical protein